MELYADGKRARASSGISTGDRLSALPDCNIRHIMSFMKARQVVQTCVLSMRWRHLRRSVPCLDVDDQEFKTTGVNRASAEELEKFEDFTDHLLIPNNISIAHLDAFRLHVSDRYHLVYCKGAQIKSSSLKNLIIDDCTGASNNLIITVPAVAYLFLSLSSYYFGGGDWFNEMPSLVKAHVNLWDNHGESEFSKDQGNLLCSLSNVTSLELLDFQTMEPLLDSCDLSDNFKILEHFLKHSPYLEKLTLRCCKFSKDLKRRKGKAKSKAASSSQRVKLVDAECKNLKLTEIIYKDDDVRPLVELLLSISGHLPKNNIKLTKAD
ncbi:hypothetical protein PR202_ga20258 [Eleusine coracana subsp. coracana]|uniref:Uncharacterized protein n=1 Tax=Eleusine coracana subsp. coracana TaxID=191504 RepID=A0AAV5CXQ6_ELECO|nr:hypothetical protein PR202_ga20258 [Eleusine coracana subsp. coracana]